MDFSLSQAHLALQQTARQFAQREVEPIAAEIDESGRYPIETWDKMVACGFTGIGTPLEYGGSGADDLAKILVVEELAKKCGSTAAILSIHTLFADLILKFGSEEQKRFYLPQVGKGGKLGAFALTEPNAGSDAGAAKTTAELQGDEYVLNGTKCFITGGGQAEYIVVIASTDLSKGIKGLSAFIVHRDSPGFSVGKIEDKMGIRASETVELIFDNCRIPKENQLGKLGDGFKMAMIGLDGARIGAAAQGLGLAEGAMEEAVKYMKERVQFGKPLTAQQGLSWYIADMETQIETARWAVYYAAWCKEHKKVYTKEAAIAKYNAGNTARFVTNLALQIHGGYGFMKDYPLERMLRDSKIIEIYEGTAEIHKVVISRAVLK